MPFSDSGPPPAPPPWLPGLLADVISMEDEAPDVVTPSGETLPFGVICTMAYGLAALFPEATGNARGR